MNKKHIPYIFTLILILAISMNACTDEGTKTQTTAQNGKENAILPVGVDESVQPVMQQQFKVWDSSYPESKMNIRYTTELELFKGLFSDSFKMIITTRDLNAEERKTAKANNMYLNSLSVARDAAVIIVHPKAADTKMTLGILKNIILGKYTRKYTVVFDNANSSLVKMIQDTVLQGESYPSTVFAAGDNAKVIDYVSKNENAIGIIGMTHAYDPKNTDGAGRFKPEIKVVSIYNDTANQFFEPYQVFVATMEYPLTRRIFFITREAGRGTASSFANFLTQPEGQLIFKKSWLVPLRVELDIREATLN